MSEGAALGQRIECLVGASTAGRDGPEKGADAGRLQPVQHQVRAVDADEDSAEPVQFRDGGAAAGRG